MPSFSNKLGRYANNIAFLSMAAGIASLFSFFNPPTGFFFGTSAMILAYLTRSLRNRLGIPGILGAAAGLTGALLSVFAFFNFIFVIRLMDDPEQLIQQIQDPALAQQLRDVLLQYRDLLFSIKTK